MTDPYTMVKGGKLKFKKKIMKKLKRKREAKEVVEEDDPKFIEDTNNHGGWWAIDEFSKVTGNIAIEMGENRYIEALDNGLFCIGKSHEKGTGPKPSEIFSCMRVNDNHVAFKSGFNKYMGVQRDAKVVGVAEAISLREQWQPVFQDGKVALLGCNECFLTRPEKGGFFNCTSTTADDSEFIKLRSSAVMVKQKTEADEDLGKAKDVELNYVKKYQSFEDKRIKVNQDDVGVVKKARKDGTLHEALLDRREKMKSDKFCK